MVRFVALVISFCVVLLSAFGMLIAVGDSIDEKEAKLPTKCHVCKHLVREIRDELAESSKTNDVLQIGQPFQGGVKKIPYRQSETRLTEAIENACSNVLDYKVHKDKPDAIRYEKVESVTFKTLKGLKKRGVKVDLGFPDEMWDSPDAEVQRLKNRCEFMVEKYEDEISEWYWKYQQENLTQWLCVERVLDPNEDECLNETKAWEEVRDKERKEKEKGIEENKNAGNKKENDKKEEKRKKGKTSKSRKDKHLREKSEEDEDESAKIQRLIREQAEMQADSGYRGRSSDSTGPKRITSLTEKKIRKLRLRLLEASEDHDSSRLWRELRTIRRNELSEDEIGYMREPWEKDLADRIPEETRHDLYHRRYEHFTNPVDLRRELELLARTDDEDNHRDPDSSRVREIRWSLLNDSEDLSDMKELRERIKDLEAFSAIFDTHSDDDEHRRNHNDGDNKKNRPYKHYHDEF